MLLALLELMAVSFVIIIIITQLVIPLFRGTKLFPMLGNEPKLISEIEDLKQQKVEAALQEDIEEMKEAHKKEEPKPEDGSKSTSHKMEGVSDEPVQ